MNCIKEVDRRDVVKENTSLTLEVVQVRRKFGNLIERIAKGEKQFNLR